jgi:hypothetical protein
MSIFRKALTKPIWLWETRRQYPIRDVVFRFPPITTALTAGVNLAIRTVDATIPDAAWSAYSFLRYLSQTVTLTFVGPRLSETRTKQLQLLFPQCTVVQDHELASRCSMDEYRNVYRLAEYHPMGWKLLSVLQLQKESSILYADADVLCFNRPSEIIDSIAHGLPEPLYIQDVCLPCEPITERNASALGLKPAHRLNCGFMAIPKCSLDISLANKILDTHAAIESWFPDTIVLAMLMGRASASPLPEEYYVNDTQRQFFFETDCDYRKIRARHFVGPVRHLMYKYGMPYLRREWSSSGMLH